MVNTINPPADLIDISESDNTAIETLSDEARLKAYYSETADTFLRHEPLTTRAKYVSRMMDVTKFFDWTDGNLRHLAAGAVQKGFGSTIKYHRGKFSKDIVGHEAIHFMQEEQGLMPQNNALTYAFTQTQQYIDNPSEFINDDESYSTVHEDYKNIGLGEYAQMVFNGDVSKIFKAGWMSDKRAAAEFVAQFPEDKFARGIETYLNNEEVFNQRFRMSGEVGLTEVDGVRDPYNVMANVGTARAKRAYALGHFTGDIENTWTLLWLHSRGYDFEEAEKLVLQKCLDGTIGDLSIDQKLDPTKLDYYLKAEEVFGRGDKKIKQGILTKPGNWLESAKNYTRRLLRKNEKIDDSEIDFKFNSYIAATSELRTINSESGARSLNISTLIPSINHAKELSQLQNAESGANIYSFPDRNGQQKLSLLEFGTSNIPFVNSYVPIENPHGALPERIGRVYVNRNRTSPDSSDILNLIEDNSSVFNIVVFGNKIYCLEKNPDNAYSHNEASREDLKSERSRIKRTYADELMRAIKNDNSDEAEQAFLNTCKQNGIRVYIAESSEEYSDKNLALAKLSS